MLDAPWITWLLVRTSPDGEMITPVPAACPLGRPIEGAFPIGPPMTVVMSTTAGSTLSARACAFSPLSGLPEEGTVPGTVVFDLDVPDTALLVRPHPMPTPDASRTNPATRAATRPRPRRCGGGPTGGPGAG